ncbi:hypothetical protein HDK77DRAFT_312048 [Phyllosticta capitalensis]
MDLQQKSLYPMGFATSEGSCPPTNPEHALACHQWHSIPSLGHRGAARVPRANAAGRRLDVPSNAERPPFRAPPRNPGSPTRQIIQGCRATKLQSVCCRLTSCPIDHRHPNPNGAIPLDQRRDDSTAIKISKIFQMHREQPEITHPFACARISGPFFWLVRDVQYGLIRYGESTAQLNFKRAKSRASSNSPISACTLESLHAHLINSTYDRLS